MRVKTQHDKMFFPHRYSYGLSFTQKAGLSWPTNVSSKIHRQRPQIKQLIYKYTELEYAETI